MIVHIFCYTDVLISRVLIKYPAGRTTFITIRKIISHLDTKKENCLTISETMSMSEGVFNCESIVDKAYQ